ncbi:PEBP-like protein [Glonium stellatum]|uniref:PEBP-like protein n=1 Tax=Glonium stellatum TaxID=574774 RepID=A0A8E2EMX7_9PEZI|nr:PEBP-like protein [Glonium stellatum]
MRLWNSILILVGLAGVSRAQTPAGFTPSVATHLDVMFNSTVVSPAGLTLAKAITQSQPTIGLTGIDSSGTFLFIMMGTPSRTPNSTRQTLLHCLNTGFKSTAPRTPSANTTILLASADTGPAPYLGPSPPAESPPHGHRYVQFLFRQPDAFVVPADQQAAVSARRGFDLQGFVRAAGLGEPVAADFFVVVGGQSQLASASASGTGTGGGSASATASVGIAKSSLLPFEGAAVGGNARRGSGWMAVVAGVLGLAVL